MAYPRIWTLQSREASKIITSMQKSNPYQLAVITKQRRNGQGANTIARQFAIKAGEKWSDTIYLAAKYIKILPNGVFSAN